MSIVVCGVAERGVLREGLLEFLQNPMAFVADGNGSPNGEDSAGTVFASASGALRYFKRPNAPAYTLKYPPPVLVNPIVVNPGARTSGNFAANSIASWAPQVWTVGKFVVVEPKAKERLFYKCIKETASSGNEPPNSTFWEPCAEPGCDNTRDYIWMLTTLRTNELAINGGRNHWLIGAEFALALTAEEIEENETLPANSQRTLDAAILITDNSTNGAPTPQEGRTVHIEGIFNHNANELYGPDGIDYSCPTANVQIQNVRAVELKGAFNAVRNGKLIEEGGKPVLNNHFHSDITQNQGGVLSVKYDHFTGSGDYQGFSPFGPAIKNGVTVSNMDLEYFGENIEKKGTLLFWNTASGANPEASVNILENMVIKTTSRPGTTVLGNAIYRGDKNELTLTENPADEIFITGGKVTGVVIDGNANPGAIPAGGFCAEGHCGLGYQSPGYGPPKQPGAQSMFIEEGTTNLIFNPAPASMTGYEVLPESEKEGVKKGGKATVTYNAEGYIHVETVGANEGEGVAQTIAAYKQQPVKVGETVTVSVDIDSKSASPYSLQIVERNAAKEFLASQSVACFPAAEPTRFSLTYTPVNAGCEFLQVRVYVTGTTPQVAVYNIRKIQLEILGHPTSYCDGGQPGCTWIGAENASASTRPNTRVNYPVAGHIEPNSGTLAIWANIPALLPLTYLWSVGTPGVAGQDFLGVRINSEKTALELVAQTGTASAKTVSLGSISAEQWVQVSTVWSGTSMGGSINGGTLVTGVRSTPSESFNVPLELGGLTGGSARSNGYLGPCATSLFALNEKQCAQIYEVAEEWTLSLRTQH